jgi:7,8-dihydropterin-6-yl-methyl-4-(beta-D-ribofuranosyl)aminobenzene 5'-phosphate synthase
MVVGGFHLLHLSDDEVRKVIAELKELGVDRVAPTHCTGERAIEIFRQEYGDGFTRGGTGRVLLPAADPQRPQ